MSLLLPSHTYTQNYRSQIRCEETPHLPTIMAGYSKIPTKFLIVSDTYDFEFGDTARDSQPLQLPAPKADVLLHCGDLAQVGEVFPFKKTLKMLGSIDAELKPVIPGNHDLDLDNAYWEARRDDEGN